MIYKEVIEKERAFGYGGKTVRSHPARIRSSSSPHIEQRRKEFLKRISNSVEIGGTLGDYQNALFIEAARNMRLHYGGDVLFVLVSYLPKPSSLGEMKTRPTQHAVRQLNSFGIHPDLVICRGEESLDKKRKEKIAFSSGLQPEQVISAPDVKSIYEVPLNLAEEGVADLCLKLLHCKPKQSAGILTKWKKFATTQSNPLKHHVRIAVVGKYGVDGDNILKDAYVSVIEAIKFSAAQVGVHADIELISSLKFEGTGQKELVKLKSFDGVVIPGGFGTTGVDGKLATLRYTREHNIPTLGICYGMQLMAVEAMRNIGGKVQTHTQQKSIKKQKHQS